MKRILIALMVLIGVVGIGNPGPQVSASDVSGAGYLTRIVVTNNSSDTITNAIFTLDLPTQAMIDAGLLNATATDAALRTPGGVDLPFMFASNSTNKFVGMIPSIGPYSAEVVYLYSGGVTGGNYVIFQGLGGLVSADTVSMEPDDNFTQTISGYFDSTVSGNLTDKPEAIRNSGDGSGNDTATIGTADNVTKYLYDTYDTDVQTVYGVNWRAVTITANQSGAITAVGIRMKQVGAPAGNVNILIQTDNASGPGGATKATGTKDATAYSAAAGGSLYVIDLNNTVYVNNGDNFTVVVNLPAGNAGNLLRAQSQSTATDTNAWGYASPDSGVSWTYQPFDYSYTVNYGIGPSVSASGIASGEHTIIVKAESPLLGINIDNTAGFPITENLIFNLPLHHTDMTGATITSKDSNGLTATVTGATWGNYGRTFASGDIITFTGAVLPEFTLSAWVYPTLLTGGQNIFLLGEEEGNNLLAINTNSLTFSFLDNGSESHLHGANEIFINNWYQCAVTYNGSDMILYFNGADPTSFIDTTASLDLLLLGRDTSGNNPFVGIYGEAQAYNRALSPTEILAQYNATKWRYDGTVTAATNTYFPYVVQGISVPDNSENWTFVNNNVMPYVDYLETTVSGNQVQYIDWEYTAGNLTDSSGYGNDVIPSWRTTPSDADISAVVFSQVSTLASSIPGGLDSPSWTMVGGVPVEPPGLYDEGGTDYPGGPEIEEFSDDTGVPYMFWAVFLAFGTSLLGGGAAYGLVHNPRLGRNGSMFLMWVVSTVIYVLWYIGGDGVIPGWGLIPYAFIMLFLMVWFNPFKTAAG